MDILEELLKTTREAGIEILRYYDSQDKVIQIKSDNSPVTIADHRSNALICARLHELTPDIPVVSEEDSAHSAPEVGDRFWLVDPLDGTKEFIAHTGDFSINVSLVQNQLPVMGILHHPIIGKSYFAWKGGGAHLEDKTLHRLPIHCRKPSPPRLTCLISRSHQGDEEKYLQSIHPDWEFIPVGSALKFCVLAEGKADVYFRRKPSMEWDTAAGQCILEEAGGSVLQTDGTPLLYRKNGFRNTSFIALSSTQLDLSKIFS